MPRLCYIAEPIDQASGARWSELLTSAIEFSTGWSAYLPSRAFAVDTSAGPDPRLEQINRAALDRADALIAFVPGGVASVGVPRELEAFASTGRPWAVCTDVASWSLQDAHAVFALRAHSAAVQWLMKLPDSPSPLHPARVPLLFAKVGNFDGQLPTRAHHGDAGYDLYAAEDVVIPYDQFRDVPCGVRVALPPDVWGRIVGRSSTLRRRALLVTEGIIDTGYRGPLFAGVRNLGPKGTIVEKGERIAQMILMPNLASEYRAAWASADEFAAIPHDGRGDHGFGSTGN